MSSEAQSRPIEVLLVEDNPADAELARIGLSDGVLANRVHVAYSAEAALAFLHREGEHGAAPRPDIVILDLNLPGMDGRELLRCIKADPDLGRIPVVVLTTSDAARDIDDAYSAHASAYMVKPIDFLQFHELMRRFKDFWFTQVRLH